MMDDTLVALLSEAKHLPKDALRRAAAKPDLIAGPVLRAIEVAADNPERLTEEDLNLIFWGLHAMAAARDARIFHPLLRLLRQDEACLDDVLGDAVTSTLPQMLASSFDGDFDALSGLLLDSTVDEFVAGSAFTAMSFLVREGRIDGDRARALLIRYDDARIAVEESFAWSGWEQSVAYLGLSDLAGRVEAAHNDGRITDDVSDLPWFRRALRQVTSVLPDFRSFAGENYGYLDDPIRQLAWTAEEAGLPVINPFKDIGRNDPCPCGSGKKYKKCCLSADPDGKPLIAPLPGLH